MGKGALSAKILKAMSIFSGVQMLSVLCSVVRTKLIALWIGPIGVGLFAIFNTVLDMVSATTQLNMRETSVRDISVASEQRAAHVAAIVRWWAVRLGLGGMVLMILLSPLFSYFNFDDTSHWLSFVLLSAAVLALAVNAGEQALMQGRGRLGLLAKSSTVSVIVATALSIPLYYFFRESSIIPSILLFAFASMTVLLVYRVQPSAHNTMRENIRGGLEFLRLGVYMTVSTLSITACNYAFISYIGHVASNAEVGVYQAGYTLVIKYVSIVFSALSLEYFPRLVTVAKRRHMASVIVSHEMSVILAVIAPMVVIFIAADDIVLPLLYSDKFMSALPFATIGICGTVFRAISYSMSYVMIARGDGVTFVITDIMSAVIGLTLNIVMFRYGGFEGLGLSYVLWYAIYTVIVGVVYYQRYGMRLSRSSLWLIVCTCIIVTAALLLKPIAWWAPLTLLLPSAAMAYSLKK